MKISQSNEMNKTFFSRYELLPTKPQRLSRALWMPPFEPRRFRLRMFPWLRHVWKHVHQSVSVASAYTFFSDVFGEWMLVKILEGILAVYKYKDLKLRARVGVSGCFATEFEHLWTVSVVRGKDTFVNPFIKQRVFF